MKRANKQGDSTPPCLTPAFGLWYEESMVRKAIVRIDFGTKGLWDEWYMARMVYTWYEKSVV